MLLSSKMQTRIFMILPLPCAAYELIGHNFLGGTGSGIPFAHCYAGTDCGALIRFQVRPCQRHNTDAGNAFYEINSDEKSLEAHAATASASVVFLQVSTGGPVISSVAP